MLSDPKSAILTIHQNILQISVNYLKINKNIKNSGLSILTLLIYGENTNFPHKNISNINK